VAESSPLDVGDVRLVGAHGASFTLG
jgi:hypothetical protein